MNQEHAVAESLVFCTALDFCGVASVGGGNWPDILAIASHLYRETCFCV